MINKGKARSNGRQLGDYLNGVNDVTLAGYLKREKNDRVQVLEIRGSAFDDLERSVASWETEAAGTRCKKPLWHAQMSPAHEDKLTREQQMEAVNILEKHLGLEGQPRTVVIHEKKAHEHIHVVWSRMDRETHKARRDSFTHKKNVAAAREIELRFGLRLVDSPAFDKEETREERREKSKKASTYRDHQKARRTGLDPKKRKEEITAIWHQTDSGKALKAALDHARYILAYGDKRDYVVVDRAGDIHSLPRQINDAKTKDVRQRLSDIDPASIPQVKHVQQQLRHAWQERQAEEKRRSPKIDAEDTSKERKDLSKQPNDLSGEARAPSSGSHPAPKARVEEANPSSLKPADILAGITRAHSTFTEHDLEYEISCRLESHQDIDGVADPVKVAAIFAGVRALDDFVALGPDRTERPRFTSREILTVELKMRDRSDTLAARQAHPVKQSAIDNAPSAAELDEGQRKAFNYTLQPTGLVNITGPAGAGKSRTLKAVNEAFVASGYRTTGCAIAGIAAGNLQDSSGIRSQTIDSLLSGFDNVHKLDAQLAAKDHQILSIKARGERAQKFRADLKAQRDMLAERVDRLKLSPRDVIFVDEAGMLDSRKMNTLLSHAEKSGAKVVLIGDAEQLQAIDAGGAFRALSDRHGSVRIDRVRRQEEEWQRKATEDFSQGFTADALEAYRKNGQIHQAEDTASATKQLVDNWKESRQANPDQVHLMLAFTKNDVAELNQTARTVYAAERKLGIDEAVKTHYGSRDFATGDRLYFREGNKTLGVVNGSLGTVEKIKPNELDRSHRITVRLDAKQGEGAEAKTVTFNTNEYTKFDHGYAVSMHRSQGATAHRAHVLASKYMDRHAAYVSMSRHVKRVDMYYGADDIKSFDSLLYSLSRDRRKDTTLDYLDRAEKAREPERFWETVRKVIKPGAEYEREQAKKAFLKSVGLGPKKTAEEKAAVRLQDILRDNPEKKRKGTLYPTM